MTDSQHLHITTIDKYTINVKLNLAVFEYNNKKGNKMKILIVDDDGTNLPAYEALFEHAGHHVLTAPNGEQALELLKKNPTIEILLTDLNMPGIDGFETIIEAKKIKPSIRAFLGSGAIGDTTEKRAKDAGAEAVFSKSYDVEYICAVFEKQS